MTKLTDIFDAEQVKILRSRIRSKTKDARNRGIAYGLTESDWCALGNKLLGNGNCDYTDMPLTRIVGSPMYPTLERIDDKKGYVTGNVCVVGDRINVLKDVYVDKPTKYQGGAKLTREDIKMIIILLNNKEDETFFENLKKKYVSNPETVVQSFETKETKQENIMTTNTIASTVNLDAVEKKEPQILTRAKLPQDVEIAAGYSTLCRAYAASGQEVTITFSQYKAIFNAKRCPFTGEDLDERYPVIMNPHESLHAGNLKMSSQKVGSAVAALLLATGGSVQDLAKNLKRFA